MSRGTTLPIDFGPGRLRRLRAADLAAFQAYRALPELGRYQGWTPMREDEALTFLTRMQEKPLFRPGEWIQLGIADSAGDRLIGDIGIHLSDDGLQGEVGFTLEPHSQGRGIATAAVGAAVQLVFDMTAVREMIGAADQRNLASARLMQRLGFAFRHSRQAYGRNDEALTEDVYALSRR